MPLVVIGIILLVIGFVAAIPVLWTIGIICLVIGLALIVLSYVGGAAAGAGPPAAGSRYGRWGRWW